jgi:hypothetical protein
MEAPEQPKRGRKPLPPEQRRSELHAERVTPPQKEALRAGELVGLLLLMEPRQQDKLQRLAAALQAKSGAPCDAAAWLRWQIDMAKEPR